MKSDDTVAATKPEPVTPRPPAALKRANASPQRTSAPLTAEGERTVPRASTNGRARPTVDSGQHFFDREMSWLAFNSRVLEEAINPDNPLLERLKFIAIFSNNLDEFFMIHIPGMMERYGREDVRELAPKSPVAAIRAIRARLIPMLAARFACYEDTMGQLARHGIHLVSYKDLLPVERDQLQRYFEREVFPVLTPLAVDPGHPFPYLSNLSLSLAVVVRDPRNSQDHLARVKVPGRSVLPRLVAIDGKRRFVLLEEVISANLGRLFTGMQVRAAYPFRVTRNADLELQEESANDLLEMIEEELVKRRFGELVRLEVTAAMPEELRRTIMSEVEAAEEEVYVVDGPLNMGDLLALTTLDAPELRDPPFVPSLPPALRESQDIFAAIRRGDIVLHHPYESFGCVADFIRRAAEDPQVLTIKHTLYRTSGESPILEALIDAAERGKQVACLVELKARFDEANNITWARQLEKAGVHVVYGLLGLKTHCKVTLIVRREEEGLRRYVHIGTGNYNPHTAAVYTDLGLLTCSPDICTDATDIFNYLTGYSRQDKYCKFLVAPVTLRSGLEALIQREIRTHTEGRPGRIVAKMNSLVDPQLIEQLYTASAAGVKIDLIVRGICCLRPRVEGLSENIQVISVVGRFLEHSRIFYFGNAGNPELYFGSSDWMPRNLDRRVEVVAPIESAELKQGIFDNVLKPQLEDNCQAWELQPDGRYVRRRPAPGESRRSAQEILLKKLAGKA